jgi:hypothetical protein
MFGTRTSKHASTELVADVLTHDTGVKLVDISYWMAIPEIPAPE